LADAWDRHEPAADHQRGLAPAALGHERTELAPPVVTQHDHLAVDERFVHRQAAHRPAIPKNRSVKSAPNRVQTLTRSPCFKAMMR
jgi:hypothetical protein